MALNLGQGAGTAHAATNPAPSGFEYVTTGYLYDQCKADLKAAAGDQDKFAKTYCGASMIGFVSGFTIKIYARAWDDPKTKPENPSRVCLPKNFSPQKLAEDFIHYLDTAHYDVSREQAMKDPSFYGMGEFYNIYYCRPEGTKSAR